MDNLDAGSDLAGVSAEVDRDVPVSSMGNRQPNGRFLRVAAVVAISPASFVAVEVQVIQ